MLKMEINRKLPLIPDRKPVSRLETEKPIKKTKTLKPKTPTSSVHYGAKVDYKNRSWQQRWASYAHQRDTKYSAKQYPNFIQEGNTCCNAVLKWRTGP